MSKNWVSYQNGNYTVRINLKNGTKIRENNLDFFAPTTVESMDLKITNSCNMNCKYCHENSTPDGKHADLFAPSFLDNLHPYTEIAIGGGNPLSHPDLVKFLLKCRDKKWIPSMTVNQKHFEDNFELIKQLCNAELVYGLGVSLISVTESFLEKVSQLPNAVIHVIAGISGNVHNLKKLANKNLKILMLGYKVVRRGADLYKTDNEFIDLQIANVKSLLPTIMEESWFRVMSFDNLALKQFDIESMIDPEIYKLHYMGDDGIDGELTSSSMFIDLVERKFARNSCSMQRYDLLPTVEEMYDFLRSDEDLYTDLHMEQIEQF